MPKKYEISTEAQVLLKLLRIALGTEPMSADGSPIEPFPQEIDWPKVIRLSYEQKVSALAVDGLKASGYDPREGKSGRQLEELNVVLAPWFDDVNSSEESYAYYLTVLTALCQIFSANGLKTIILKGYGLSKNYPIPSHRGAGDIDVFLVDKDGNPAAEQGEQVVKEVLNLAVKGRDNKHHSIFTFKGIVVEIHYELRGILFYTNSEDLFLSQLKMLVSKGIKQQSELPAYLPSPTFNALFLMHHMVGNINSKLLNLRQMADWVTFINAHGNEVDWAMVDNLQRKAGVACFAADLNGAMMKEMGLKISLYTSFVVNNQTVNQIFKHTFSPVKHGDGFKNRLTYNYRNRWVSSYLFGLTWIKLNIRALLRNITLKD